MNRTKIAAASFFGIVFIAILGAILYIESVNANQTVSVYVVTAASAPAGTAYSTAVVQSQPIKASGGSFDFMAQAPQQVSDIFLHSLKTGDIVMQDDVAATGTKVQVTLTNVGSSGVAAGGGLVNIYGQDSSGTIYLLGSNVEVVTVGQGSVTILVTLNQELPWITLGNSKTFSLIMAGANGTLSTTNSTTSPCAALEQLTGQQCPASDATVP